MEVFILELTCLEQYTNYESKSIEGVFYTYEKAFLYMQEMCKKQNIIITKDEDDFYDCDKPFNLDASYFTIESYVVN